MYGKEVRNFDVASASLLRRPDVRVLTPEEERTLLVELDECKRLLMTWYESGPAIVSDDEESLDEHEVQQVVRELLRNPSGKSGIEQHLTTIALRYSEIRHKLAMANLRLVAHVSKKYANRGIANSDLLQEGFCGLLKAIDRFELTRETRLASYAVWWIRQALQRAVAAGAYPVRLNPRHLQQLATHSTEVEAGSEKKNGQSALKNAGGRSTIQQIHSATRPTVSLNTSYRADEGGSYLLNGLVSPEEDETSSGELDEYLLSILQQLKPRERTVLELRYGLGGTECHSLSQVSEVLDVSKERIRQIQESALRKLRTLAKNVVLCDTAV